MVDSTLPAPSSSLYCWILAAFATLALAVAVAKSIAGKEAKAAKADELVPVLWETGLGMLVKSNLGLTRAEYIHIWK